MATRAGRCGFLALWVVVAFATRGTVASAEPPRVPTAGAPAAGGAPGTATCSCAAAPPLRPHVIEVTFGNAQLFDHQGVLTTSGQLTERVIPVTSALLMAEWLLRERLSVLSLFNLPLGTQKTIVNGQSVEEFVAPALALGLRFSLLRLEVFAASHFELQLAALAGVTIGSNSGDTFFPLAAARLHFANQAGFALYLGTAFAFRKDTLAMLYGIGHRF